MLAIISLSSGKLEEKYRGNLSSLHQSCVWFILLCLVSVALFTVASGGKGSMSLEDLVSFLEQIVQVGVSKWM